MSECAWCGDDITGKSVRFKNMVFCSTECRDEWEEDMEAGEDSEFEDEEFEDEEFEVDDDDDEGEEEADSDDEEEDRY